uniref:NAD-dependent epimerase/dehydratase domain-containing protein n=1 Tax=Brassica oleracea var. oleracea TaxID=109376 RepID=A0A0D3AMX2_BRAOL
MVVQGEAGAVIRGKKAQVLLVSDLCCHHTPQEREIEIENMGRKEEDDNNGGGEMASSFLDGTGLVCVTGGTGFVASWLIMRLLQRGYSVHATVWTNPGSSLCLAGIKENASHQSNSSGSCLDVKNSNGLADLNEPLKWQDSEPVSLCPGICILITEKQCRCSRTVVGEKHKSK